MLEAKSSCHTDGSAIRGCEIGKKSDRLVKVNDVGAIGEERTEAEPPFTSTYRTESGDIYAEDVDQHMTILLEVVTPAAEISVKYI